MCIATGEPRPSTPETWKLVDTKPDAGSCEPQLHYVVPRDHVFVLGDNRRNANDSRFWGALPVKAIRGRVLGLFTPARFGPID